MHAAVRYWLRAFPAVGREIERRRELALAIPDPVLRRLALQALECKRCNVEGSAAFELLAGRFTSLELVRALSSCQTMCDYLDLLAEQPVADPVANGYRLHTALIDALSPAESMRAGEDAHCARAGEDGYYAHHSESEDGGYLQTLVEDVRDSLYALPAHRLVHGPLRMAAKRIAVYQSFNHGDSGGSYAQFERWARAQTERLGGLRWWETAAAAGSTLLLFALIACAARPRLDSGHVASIQRAYFPWIGALHTLLDSLVDLEEDSAAGCHQLIGRYESPVQAAQRMCSIAAHALAHTEALPGGRRHVLLVVAMSGFYLGEARTLENEHARAVAPALLDAVGGLARPAMIMMDMRRAARRTSSGPALTVARS